MAVICAPPEPDSPSLSMMPGRGESSTLTVMEKELVPSRALPVTLGVGVGVGEAPLPSPAALRWPSSEASNAGQEAITALLPAPGTSAPALTLPVLKSKTLTT